MRDFYDRQDHAREETFYLVALLIFGSIATIAVTAVVMAGTVLGLCYLNYIRVINWDLPEGWFLQQFLVYLCWTVPISTGIVVGTMLRRMWQNRRNGRTRNR